MCTLPSRHDYVLEHTHYKFSFLLFTTSNSSQDIRVRHSYGSTQAVTCEVGIKHSLLQRKFGGALLYAGEGKEGKVIHIEVLTQSVESGVGGGQILEERRG